MKPCLFRNRLTWQPGSCAVDPVTGLTVYQRPGLYWTPVHAAATKWPAGLAAERRRPAGAAGQYVPQTVPSKCRCRSAAPCRTGLPQGPVPDVPRGAGGVRAEGALHGLPAGRRAGREARCRCRCATWSRGAGPEGAGPDLPHGPRRARRAGAVPGLPHGGLPGDGPRAALRREADSGDLHLHGAAHGLLPRAGRRLRRAAARSAVVPTGTAPAVAGSRRAARREPAAATPARVCRRRAAGEVAEPKSGRRSRRGRKSRPAVQKPAGAGHRRID